jgi:hypothetical protein
MRRRLAVLVLFSVLPSVSHAQSDIYAPLVIQLPTGARPLAMGGWNASLRDVDAAFGNPAYAGTITSTSFSLARYARGVHSGTLSNHTTIGVIGIAIGATYLDYGALTPALDSTAFSSAVLTDRGPYAAASLAGSVALSMTFKGFRWGIAGTYLEERVESARASVVAANLGVSKDLTFANSTVGLVIQNVGPSLDAPSMDVELPMRVALGISRATFPLNAFVDLGLSGGIAVRRDGFVSASAGGELSYVPIEGIAFAFRAGARRPDLRAQEPLTVGLGGAYDRLAVDYAWEQMDGGGAHRVSVRLR